MLLPKRMLHFLTFSWTGVNRFWYGFYIACDMERSECCFNVYKYDFILNNP